MTNCNELRVAILVSAGGSIFRKTLEILKNYSYVIRFVMISDRECKAESIAREYGLPLYRVEGKDNKEFTSKCKEILDTFERIDAVMTFVTRLITDELIMSYPCVNIHPALLPAFKGMRAIDRAYATKVKFLGATLHVVDREMDHGEIIAQAIMPLRQEMTREQVLDASFIQCVYLTLLFIDLMLKGSIRIEADSKYSLIGELPFTERCNPCIENSALLHELHHMEHEKNLNVLGNHEIKMSFAYLK